MSIETEPYAVVYECGCFVRGGPLPLPTACPLHGRRVRRVEEMKGGTGNIYEIRDDGTVCLKEKG